MVALEPIKELKKKQEDLLKVQEELVEVLRTKHKDVFDWMKENNIDPFDLKSHSASLAAAFIISMSAMQPAPEAPKLALPIHVIEMHELTGKDEDEKADLVLERYGHVIQRAASKYDLDPKLIFATIMIESGGNTFAIRQEPQIGDASYGLGQILFGTARGIGFEGSPADLYDPETNIELIARYHKRNLDVYGDLTPQQLTTAYNAGSPYNTPLPGHLNKFNKWYEKVNNYIG